MERRAARQERDGVLRLLSLELIFSDERCAQSLSDARLLSSMARFEGALALASARAGVIPAKAANVIDSVAGSAVFDSASLATAARNASALAIPFVQVLKQQVAAVSPDAARFVHLGATSQDVIDTALAMCMKDAAKRIASLAIELGDAAAKLASHHRDTPMTARTLLQPAAPVPFGWKAAMWLAPIARSYPRFCEAVANGCVLQFGGAVGTLSAFGDRGQKVAQALAQELELQCVLPWQSARDGFARLGAELAILTGLAAKVGRDVALLMQPEVGEAAEPAAAGRGTSSSMPHKRNPALSLLALEAAQRAPGLEATLLVELAPEHERGIGQWQSQWLTLRELACACASALAAMAEVLGSLEVRPDVMRSNLERSNGLLYSEAVSQHLSRALADRLCAQAVRENRSLAELMRADSEVARLMSSAEIDALFEPRNAFGTAGAMIGRALLEWATARGTSP